MGTARGESARVPVCWKRPAQRGMPPSGGWERRDEEEETGETRKKGARDTSHAALPSPQGGYRSGTNRFSRGVRDGRKRPTHFRGYVWG